MTMSNTMVVSRSNQKLSYSTQKYELVKSNEIEMTKKNVKGYYGSVIQNTKNYLQAVVSKDDESNIELYVTQNKNAVLQKTQSGFKKYGILLSSVACGMVTSCALVLMPSILFSALFGGINMILLSLFVAGPFVLSGGAFFGAWASWAEFKTIHKTGYVPDVIENINNQATRMAGITSDYLYFSNYSDRGYGYEYQRYAFKDINFIRHQTTATGIKNLEAIDFNGHVMFSMNNYQADGEGRDIDLAIELDNRIAKSRGDD